MSFVDSLISLYAPHICVGCGAEGRLLCFSCRSELKPDPAQCTVCAADQVAGAICQVCRWPTSLDAMVSFAAYDEAARRVVAALKFQRARAAAAEIAELMMSSVPCRRLMASSDILIPLPTTPSRIRRRGYDQSVLLAKHLGRLSGRPCRRLLVRVGDTQQRGRDRRTRHAQASVMFSLGRTRDVYARRVLLVDDVTTTGASLESAARLLVREGAAWVGGLTFARTRLGREPQD